MSKFIKELEELFAKIERETQEILRWLEEQETADNIIEDMQLIED